MSFLYTSHFMTLDGVVTDPDVWHPRFVSDESMNRLLEEMDATSTTLMGRATYIEFASFWPTQGDDYPIARATNAISKHVVSRTLTDTDATWGDTTVLRGDPVEETAALKKEQDVVGVHGSSTLTRSLLDAGLVDEVRITLDPVIVGSGGRLFTDGVAAADLELIDATTYPLGVVQLTYRPTL